MSSLNESVSETDDRTKLSQSTTNNSALTDNTTTENHIIDWDEVHVVEIRSHTEGEDTWNRPR